MTLARFVGVLALLCSSAALANATLPPPGPHDIQAEGSSVAFEVTELGLNHVKGHFNSFAGKVIVGDSLASSRIEASIDVSSIDTNINKRNEHLKGDEWLSAQQFPKITFKSTSISGTPQSFTIKGDLTIHGTTKSVDLWTRIENDGSISADGRINRRDFGVAGSKVVSDEIRIHLKVRLAK